MVEFGRFRHALLLLLVASTGSFATICVFTDAYLFSFLRTTACRNFHITGEFNLDVAHDFSFEAIQPALCPEKDLGNLVDVSRVRRHQLAELSASGI